MNRLAAVTCLVMGLGAMPASAQPAASRANDILTHQTAAKAAAGLDFPGVMTRICIAPEAPIGSRPPGPPGPRAIPARASWYAAPYQVFDNLYWLGTKIHSAWALKTSAGLIVIDTLYNYASEAEIVDGLKTLGLDPATVKYVIISHGHGDHDEGARLLQERYGAKVVMGAPDWDLVERNTAMPGGIPKRDIVGTDGQKITLGDTSVTLVTTPGHTPGTLSMLFTVRDHGRPLTVAYSGGTAFNFPRTTANFDIYIASQRKMATAAAAAGATIVLSNHSEFDSAHDRARVAQLPRKPGEAHPFEIGAAAVGRYFKTTDECAQAARLATLAS